jgi:glycerate 2-kinase
MKILVAPNAYKECASSTVAAELIAKELKRCGYNDAVRFPLSDGGDGFLEVCARLSQLQIRSFLIRNCHNALTRRVRVGFDKKTQTFYIESAKVIGLQTIPRRQRNPLKLSTENLGELLKRLCDTRRSKLPKCNATIGIGGTGTSDLGLGLCQAFGLKLFDKSGNDLSVLPKNYSSVAKIILPEKKNFNIKVVLDVEAPLIGKNGTSKVFAGQKGASSADIVRLESGVKNVLKILRQDHNLRFHESLIGAGGGLTLGLSLIGNVHVVRSRQFLIKHMGLSRKIKECDLVITGEGRFDKQSLMEKATGIVVMEGQRQKKRIAMILGSCTVAMNTFDANAPHIYEMLPLFRSEREAILSFRKGITMSIEALVHDVISGGEVC